MRAYLQLVKIRIVALVLVVCAMGALAASGGHLQASLLFWTLLGTACLAGGAGTLNQLLERETDARMERTRLRPLPAGRLTPGRALGFGVLLTLVGCVMIVLQINVLTAFLGLLCVFLYVLVYTPMKRLTWLSMLPGSVAGAMPPLLGWSAVTGRLDLGAWLLFGMLLLWQQVHFNTVIWMFRDDYRGAGLPVLPAIANNGPGVFRLIVTAAVVLLLVSLLFERMCLCGVYSRWGAWATGVGVLAICLSWARTPSLTSARLLVVTSVGYFPALLGFLCCDLWL